MASATDGSSVYRVHSFGQNLDLAHTLPHEPKEETHATNDERII